MTRHKSENHLISNGSNRDMTRDALFSGYAPTADLTAIAQKSPILILHVTRLKAGLSGRPQ